MIYDSLQTFLENGQKAIAKGPVAIILVEDLVEVESTIRHHQKLDFASILVLRPAGLELPEDLSDTLHIITWDPFEDDATETAVNAISQATAPGTWIYYCYNAEYLMYPFMETRSVAELLAFHTEERRHAMLTYVVDLYAKDLNQHPSGVSLEDAWFDRTGYYALAREDAANGYARKERQLDFYGGLRWRFEEHVPYLKRTIDRISLFTSAPYLEMKSGHVFNDEEYNTYSCEWHHNLTASIASFRAAKALRSNPGSRDVIGNFSWHNSVKFDWNSQQLLDLGLMEPGQWF
ncbi:glycosyltransferase family 2 protein [Thalassobius sp. I31.1]|uniref:glycosyltransferase family 2 protein n=1 Tax=Thalassobius sp. I31.1 TaxID=2109912 RepID=UPI000D1BA240|nr:glycosyltransferase family 2 protein [Thalassobius sp. I31.1]